MKKTISFLPFFLLLCYCIHPLFSIIGWVYGYNFVLRNYSVCSITLAIIILITFIYLFISKLQLNKTSTVFFTLLLPMSVLNGICYISHNSTKITAIFTVIGCCCAVALFSKFAGPHILKIISGILSTLFFVLLMMIILLSVILKNDTVVRYISSPQNKYVAEVIDDDQGALGGNTFVDVINDNQTVNLLIGKFSKSPVRVYTGRWGEFANMKIRWKNGDVLVIDGKEYNMKD